MNGKLYLFCCTHVRLEVASVIEAEGWEDVCVADFPSCCGRPPLTWDELRPLIGEDCSRIIIFGRSCLKELDQPPADWPAVEQHQLDTCMDLVAGTTLVSEAIARGAYLMTPAWVADWRGNLARMGFRAESAAEFFHDFASELLLLDTGVVADAAGKLAELGDAIDLPTTRLPVGIDYLRQCLARVVAEWRLERVQRQAEESRREYARKLADHKSAMDFLGRLALLKDERETLTAIEELFHILFAPQQYHYIPFGDETTVVCSDALSPELSRQILALNGDWAWTSSETGFLLRISSGGTVLGFIVADDFAFPEYRKDYLSLALSVAGVVGLAIANARSYRRLKGIEDALRKNERSLKIAQAIAHLGHWELDVATGNIVWSDETYRILGYEPDKLRANYDTLFRAIHPEDRALVNSQINAAMSEGHFDIEFRIVLPDQRVRVVRGMGELIYFASDQQPKIVGAIQDVTPRDRKELIGVIQDITDQKELQWKLEKEARTDPLTGCANRRHFLELAEHEVARARRYNEALSMLMLDLDHFKVINDQYGHPVGDSVLLRLVQVCQATLRAEDTIGRLGGEEFAILLPETDDNKALDVAERLCRAVACADVQLNGNPPLHFTASIGATTVHPDDTGLGSVITRADKALYRAKHGGRNRVVVG
jgi:diguanylate cyclase (GGDEF)-like protein